MADRVPKRSKRDELFPDQSTWWPLGMSLDEWQQSRRAGAVVETYWTDERERAVADWWRSTQANRDRQRDGGT